LALLLDIHETQIRSVVEFYSFFHLQPRGEYDILISDSITDLMLGEGVTYGPSG
jgi:[NiFe] hydrogenase diaphorase moiety large subunit